MRKIGILTFHNAHNYGAVLQAYALKNFLIENGYNVKIINYRNKSISEAYPKKLHVDFTLRDLRHPRKMVRKMRMQSHLPDVQRQWENTYDRFEDFIVENLEDTDLIADIQALENHINEYDAIVIGSDQVWEKDLLGGKFDPAYIADFQYYGRIVVYGASKRVSALSNEEFDELNRGLKHIFAISAREEELCKALMRNGINCTNVVDPTLLLEKKYYEGIQNTTVDGELQNKNYIFAYYVVEDDCFDKVVSKISRKIGMKTIELHYYLQNDRNTEQPIVGPTEFLSYIKNASIVLTNSYHGTIFSIIYGKNFWVITRENARISNLLCRFGLKDRIIRNSNIELDYHVEINYNNVKLNKELLVDESKRFLLQSLQL